MARRRKGNTDSQYYYKWLEKALSDLQSARILLTWGGDEMAVAFHCQQAIEKALKGYLLFKLGRHFDGHNLTFLCRQAATTITLKRAIRPTCRLKSRKHRFTILSLWQKICSA